MKKVTDTFEFMKEVDTNRYKEELQETVDKLTDLIVNASKYINDERYKDEQYPIWEFVEKENQTILFAVCNMLFEGHWNTGLEDDKNRMKQIISLIMKDEK